MKEWSDLSESARFALLRQVRTLAGGFSGRIVLDCNQGGVARLTEERPTSRNDDGSRTIEIHSFDARELKKAS